MGADEEVEVTLNDRQTIESLRFVKSNRSIPVSPLGMLEVNFRGGSGTFQYIKAKEIMTPGESIRIEVNRQIASVSKKEFMMRSPQEQPGAATRVPRLLPRRCVAIGKCCFQASKLGKQYPSAHGHTV